MLQQLCLQPALHKQVYAAWGAQRAAASQCSAAQQAARAPGAFTTRPARSRAPFNPPRPPAPAALQERRKELVKSVKDMGEEGKVAVRNVRKDAMKKVDKVRQAVVTCGILECTTGPHPCL